MTSYLIGRSPPAPALFFWGAEMPWASWVGCGRPHQERAGAHGQRIRIDPALLPAPLQTPRSVPVPGLLLGHGVRDVPTPASRIECTVGVQNQCWHGSKTTACRDRAVNQGQQRGRRGPARPRSGARSRLSPRLAEGPRVSLAMRSRASPMAALPPPRFVSAFGRLRNAALPHVSQRSCTDAMRRLRLPCLGRAPRRAPHP